MKAFRSLVRSTLVLWLGAVAVSGQASWLDPLDDSLHLQSPSGLFRSNLSGLLDLEGYYIDQRPPGLVLSDDKFFFNPRLSLFLDSSFGPHIYSFVQARFDRGFDPGSKPHDARLDEYLLRYIPFEDARFNLQVGKFATVIGNWIPRHNSWNNPFINAPLPYESVVSITDRSLAGSPAAFLKRRDIPQNKPAWVPPIWGPSYASGLAAFGRIEKFDYALEIKNAALSSRPYAWDLHSREWDTPTVSGRASYRPNPAWNSGASFSIGSYLLPDAKTLLPAGTTLEDFKQITLGQDLSYAWRHWQFWEEAFATRFEVPNVGNADTIAYYLEAKYKITTHLFTAVRWNQQFFDQVPDGAGGRQPWDRDLWRVDAALGLRFDRHLQTKLQYSYNHRKGPLQQGEQLAAVQVTVKF